ncbi:ATP-dependent nuclease [Lacrimispora indolis]|uniref:ATP-dependent nuclease n=1 Tax=Lacrimispora indolis TaxID=69825 RepID=UPI003564EC0D
MKYSTSDIDLKNHEWFQNDINSRSLKTIRLEYGQIRGLHPCQINFTYPISAIAGENGSGKSTLLALSCCAYHNTNIGYVPIDHNKSYYTFSDFFVQTTDEMKVEGISIWYEFLTKWKGGREGSGWQHRTKKRGGKWTKYDTRVHRNVVFLGIQRIVPPGERKTERSYYGKFKSSTINQNTKNRILDIASKVLGKKYTTLDLRTVDRRRLFVVDRKEKHYSGFNMGAGENAVFSLLIELFSAGKNTLLVIDEIELGLHESAQKRLIQELKKLCLELHCQIICSTHSCTILDCLPPEGRFYLESVDGMTNIFSNISSEYATGKLSAGEKKELSVYTEDEVGCSILQGFLPNPILRRIKILPIGSDQAVLKQLAAAYRVGNHACIAFCDGDKRQNYEKATSQVKRHLEGRINDNFNEWIQKRLNYLPGDTRPEQYLLELLRDNKNSQHELALLWQTDFEFENSIEQALSAGKHNEFHYLAKQLNLNEAQVRIDVIRTIKKSIPEDIKLLETTIHSLLGC